MSTQTSSTMTLTPLQWRSMRPARSGLSSNLSSNGSWTHPTTLAFPVFSRNFGPLTQAEGVGFEPTRRFRPLVFKTSSIGRSDSPPAAESTEPAPLLELEPKAQHLCEAFE